MHSHLHGLGFSQPHSCWISSTPKDFLRSFSPDPRAPEQQDLPTAALGTPFKAFIRFWNPNRDTHMRLKVLISPISPQTCWNRGCPIPGSWAGWAWSSLGWGARCPCPDWDGFFPAQTLWDSMEGRSAALPAPPGAQGLFFTTALLIPLRRKDFLLPSSPLQLIHLTVPPAPSPKALEHLPRASQSCNPLSVIKPCSSPACSHRAPLKSLSKDSSSEPPTSNPQLFISQIRG